LRGGVFVLNGVPMPTIKKWSMKHNCCRQCGTKKIKHKGRGLCIKCYDRENEKRQRSHSRNRGIAGKKLTRECLIEEYWKKQKSLNDIAKECSCTRQYVYKKLKQYNLPIRSKKSARSLALERGKLDFNIVDEDGIINLIKLQKIDVNEDFFSAWSNEMAWVLGLIFSDGNLHDSEPRLHITQKEPELLEKVKSLMNCNAKLIHSPKKIYKSGVSGETYTLQIFNQKIFDALTQIGLTPDKSLTVNFPDIPAECIRYFIRGCWDGDGSVFIDNQSGYIRASYISGSLNFIKGMLNELERAGFPKRTIHKTRSKTPSYYFRFYGEQCKKLYHFLYDDVPPEQYLERKHKVFEDYFGVLLKQK
jgi:hypothetical protein